jgi:hypothetical protein
MTIFYGLISLASLIISQTRRSVGSVDILGKRYMNCHRKWKMHYNFITGQIRQGIWWICHFWIKCIDDGRIRIFSWAVGLVWSIQVNCSVNLYTAHVYFVSVTSNKWYRDIRRNQNLKRTSTEGLRAPGVRINTPRNVSGINYIFPCLTMTVH